MGAEHTTSVRDACRGATDQLIELLGGVRYDALDTEVIATARRHLIDTVGVMIAGAGGDVARRSEQVLARLHRGGDVPVAGSTRRADIVDAAFLGGASAHGLELDDGYREGSVHPGAVVVPVALATAAAGRRSGRDLLAAIVGGYEVVTALGRACHPRLRRAGFHPTAVVGPFGAAFTAAVLRAASPSVLANAIGIAASSAGGLFAFVNGGADVKRLHAANAARDGLLAVLLAEAGVAGPPGVLEARDGFFQAFVGHGGAPMPSVSFAPDGQFGITACYLKPYACCRHLHPAIDALLHIVRVQHVRPSDVAAVNVETYRIAAEHAEVGWADFASAQLSFRYVLATALLHGSVDIEHFDDAHRRDPAIVEIASRVHVASSATLDATYPACRPARVTVRSGAHEHVHQADEALGAPELPLDEEAVRRKFRNLTSSVLGADRADRLAARLSTIDEVVDVASVLEQCVAVGARTGEARGP